VTLARDRVTFPVEGLNAETENESFGVEQWQRWNDYGIGLLLSGKSQLRQAAEAFKSVEELGRPDGPLNLARVYLAEGRLDEAGEALQRAAKYVNPAAPSWTLHWLSGQVNRQQGHLDDAIESFRSVVDDRTAEMVQREFDFSLDYEVLNDLGLTLFQRAQRERGEARKQQRHEFVREAIRRFQQTLAIDSESATAHYNLALLYEELADEANAEHHRAQHARYKDDDNAAEVAIKRHRAENPAANHAAESVVIYSLHRPGAPGLAADVRLQDVGVQRETGDGS
jgi:tetratricopeptide (TPR) repeat protein